MIFLVLWSLKATATILLGGLLVLALWRRSAAARCLALRVTLAAAWLLAVAILFAPRIEIALPKPAPEATLSTPPLPTVADQRPASIEPVSSSKVPMSVVSTATPVSLAPAQGSTPVPVGTMLLGLYAGGVFVLAVRWLAGLLRLRRIARHGQWVAPGVVRVIELGVPATFGFRRPAVLLPAASVDWPEERIRAAILHEEAHIRRRDWLWQNLMNLFVTLHWFNPAVWLLARGLRDTAEAATDDEVLSHGLTPSVYARELLAVAKNVCPVGPAIPMARRGGVVERVASILDRDRDRRMPTRYLAVVLLLISALAGLALAGITAKRTRSGDAQRLANGGTVEIVAVHELGTVDSIQKPRRVWEPDGRQLPDDKYSYGFIAPKTDDYRPLMMEVKISDAGREPVAAKILGDSSHSISLFTGDDQSGNHDLRLVWRAPVDQPTQDIRLALATGDWKPYQGAKVTFKTCRRVVSTREGEAPGIWIEYAFPRDLDGRNVRMNVVLKDGRRRPIGAVKMGQVPEKKAKPSYITMTAQIAGNDPKDVVGLEFDYRDYENVLFPGIALQPKGGSLPPSVDAEIIGLGYPGGKAWRPDGTPDATLKPPDSWMPTVAGWRRLSIAVRLRGQLKDPWVRTTKWDDVLSPNRSDTFTMQDVPGSPNEKIAWCSMEVRPEPNHTSLGIDVCSSGWRIDVDATPTSGVEIVDKGRLRMPEVMHRYAVRFPGKELPDSERDSVLEIYGQDKIPIATYLSARPLTPGGSYDVAVSEGQKIRRLVLRSRAIQHFSTPSVQLWSSDTTKARLADGRTIELLGLSKLDESPVATWSPDGTRPQTPPSPVSIDLRSSILKGLQAHFRIAGAPHPDTTVSFRISYSSSVMSVSPGFDGFENWYAQFSSPPTGVRNATLSVGVAFEPWESVKRFVNFKRKSSDSTAISCEITDIPADTQIRLAGFDKTGRSLGVWRVGGSITRHNKTEVTVFSNSPNARNLVRVELQQRRIRWTAIPNVAVVPRS